MEIDTVDSSGGQLMVTSTVEDVSALDFEKINPVTGPIGSTVPNRGYSQSVSTFCPLVGAGRRIPGFGLFADQFTEPALHTWRYDSNTLSPRPTGRVAEFR
ncbi:MAG: hypothetical protein Ct9H300mP14_03650 [Gammaproteobacteria bacterium]|nr:MAG: hypothetical protein Ct9H300mP14_03650 [Gammaproteobacteria bacterium]